MSAAKIWSGRTVGDLLRSEVVREEGEMLRGPQNPMQITENYCLKGTVYLVSSQASVKQYHDWGICSPKDLGMKDFGLLLSSRAQQTPRSF